jgi:hypothetical protein
MAFLSREDILALLADDGLSINVTSVGGTVAPAAAAAPTFGQKTAPTGTATALASTQTFATRLTIYPDPSTDVYIARTAITTTTGATTGILRASGPALEILGPIDPSTLYVLAPSGSPVLSFVGQ